MTWKWDINYPTDDPNGPLFCMRAILSPQMIEQYADSEYVRSTMLRGIQLGVNIGDA